MTIQEIATDSRRKCLELVFKAQTSHIGSLFSCAEIFATVFDKIDLDKDKFVLSAGWKACMLYYHLWRKGRITEEELNSYCQPGSKFIGLCEPVIPEIPISGGSMGIGTCGSVGLALAKKLKGEEGKIYCLMSDGEQAIGTTWESASIASHHKLNNLVVLIDRNLFQAMGKTEDVLKIEPLRMKWRAFGWETREVNGHSVEAINDALTYPKIYKDRPTVIICNTIKGYGWKRAEGNNLYHYLHISEEDYQEAMKELT